MPSALQAPTGLDHLVVLAEDLASGVAWCEAMLGVLPGSGGEHPLMGTHNRLLRIDSPAFPQAYLEIIAINPNAQPLRAAPLRRWFDMDDMHLMQEVRRHGPQLAHWVARVDNLGACLQTWAGLGLLRGQVLQAQRPTAHGLLEWQISVRDDGQRLMQGCLPTLIAWGDVHPVDHMPKSPLQLTSLCLTHPQAVLIGEALSAASVPGVTVQAGPADIIAVFDTPKGAVSIRSR